LGTLYLVCAVVGAVLLIAQLGMTAAGAADLGDVDVGDSLNLLSVRSIVAAITFFGVGGLLATSLGLGAPLSLGAAAALALAAAVATAWLTRSLRYLESDGTAHVESAIGQPATVYLRVPGNRQGVGKVVLELQGRSVEYQAVSHLELPTGAEVVVVDVIGPDTVEVAPPYIIEGS
jgi:hypothetical protein